MKVFLYFGTYKHFYVKKTFKVFLKRLEEQIESTFEKVLSFRLMVMKHKKILRLLYFTINTVWLSRNYVITIVFLW